MADLHHYRVNGNGNANGYMPLPQSKRAFQRSLPSRLGGLEDSQDDQDHILAELQLRIMSLEARADTAADAASIELMWGVVDMVRLTLGKRQSRRRPQRSPSNQLKLNLQQ